MTRSSATAVPISRSAASAPTRCTAVRPRTSSSATLLKCCTTRTASPSPKWRRFSTTTPATAPTRCSATARTASSPAGPVTTNPGRWHERRPDLRRQRAHCSSAWVRATRSTRASGRCRRLHDLQRERPGAGRRHAPAAARRQSRLGGLAHRARPDPDCQPLRQRLHRRRRPQRPDLRPAGQRHDQGDGSILGKVVGGNPVAAARDGSLTGASGLIHGRDASDRALVRGRCINDGDDYIEGNAGSDLIFGNLGQDDIIGGSSEPVQPGRSGRPARRRIRSRLRRRRHRRRCATTWATAAMAATPTPITGDNGNIYRLVSAGGAYFGFNYDDAYGIQLVPRAIQLLDYTPGGTGSLPAASVDIGAADEIHGESGDDQIYGHDRQRRPLRRGPGRHPHRRLGRRLDLRRQRRRRHPRRRRAHLRQPQQHQRRRAALRRRSDSGGRDRPDGLGDEPDPVRDRQCHRAV